MKTRYPLPVFILFAALCSYAFNTQAATAPIKVSSLAEVEVEVVESGKKIIRRGTPDKAVPGTEVIFTDTFENVSDKAAGDIVINNPIPENMKYKGGSAFCTNCAIVFSADGGKTFDVAENLKLRGADGKLHTALPGQYTHIRWSYQGQLAAGKSGEVGFRAVIN